MQARRGKSIIMVGTKTFARMTEEQFAVTLLEKEHEHKKLLKQQEDELHQRSKEEMNAKIRDIELKHKVALQQRDHKMALQAKELQIKELELIEAKMRQETTAVHHHEYPATQLGLPRPAYTAPSFNYATGNKDHCMYVYIYRERSQHNKGPCPKSLWKNYVIMTLTFYPPSPALNVTAFQHKFNTETLILLHLAYTFGIHL